MYQNWPVTNHKIRTRKSKNISRQYEMPQELITGAVSRFPHIVDNLRLYWGQKEFSNYVNGLSMQNRKVINESKEYFVKRNGFPAPVFFDIVRIVDAHKIAFPQIIIASNPFSFTIG